MWSGINEIRQSSSRAIKERGNMKVKITLWDLLKSPQVRETSKGGWVRFSSDVFLNDEPIEFDAESVEEEIKVTSCQHKWLFNKDSSLGICSNCKESVGGISVGDNAYIKLANDTNAPWWGGIPENNESFKIGINSDKAIKNENSLVIDNNGNEIPNFTGFTNLPLEDVKDIHRCASKLLEMYDKEKKPLTNLEKWNLVWVKYNSETGDDLSVDFIDWLDSKGVSADEAYRILIEEKNNL